MNTTTRTVWLLGLTQIIGFGAVYYCFAILAKDIAQDFGWTQSQFYGCISLGLAAGGIMSPFAGKAFDRYGAAKLMAVGSMALAATLAAAALTPHALVFAIMLIAANMVSTLVLYEAAFTALVQLSPLEGSRRIVYLTLIAGFASSIFWPLTTALDASFGWRNTLLLFAAVNFFVCTPVHYVLNRWSIAAKLSEAHVIAANNNEKAGSIAETHIRFVTFLVTAGFVLSGVALSAILVQMVPVLQAIGFGPSSLWVSTLFGPAQVIVRFSNLIFGSKHHPVIVAIVSTLLLPIGLFIIAGLAPALAGAVVGVVFIGMSSGLKSIVHGTLPLALFGSKGYGTRLGFIALFRHVSAAIAPFAFAWISEQFGPVLACIGFALIGAMGLASLAWLAVVLPKLVIQANQRGVLER